MTSETRHAGELAVAITYRGWEIDVKPHRLVVAHKDYKWNRGDLRVALSIYELGETGPDDSSGQPPKETELLIDRTKINLTSKDRRNGLAQSLDPGNPEPIAKALLALEDVIRQTPPPQKNGNGRRKVLRDSPPEFADKVTKLSGLRELFGRHVLLKDPYVLEVFTGANVAHRLGHELVWLLMVAPPSGLKTELIMTLQNLTGFYYISELTPHAFASGFDAENQETSLLEKLENDTTLAFKDFTSILEMRYDERQAILAQLREIYDGRYDRSWGTGKELHWTGRLGFIGGVTPIIDLHHAVMALLGPRFVLYRIAQPDRKAVAQRAMNNSRAAAPNHMNQVLSHGIGSFLESIRYNPPTVADNFMDYLAVLSDVVTAARSSVLRDNKHLLQYVPESETPARFARQMYSLMEGVTLVNGREASTSHEAAVITRVARDCIPQLRTASLRALVASAAPLKTTDLATLTKCSTPTSRRIMEDLQSLALVNCIKAERGGADYWAITDQYSVPVEVLFSSPMLIDKIFHDKNVGLSANSGGLSQHTFCEVCQLLVPVDAVAIYTGTGGAVCNQCQPGEDEQ